MKNLYAPNARHHSGNKPCIVTSLLMIQRANIIFTVLLLAIVLGFGNSGSGQTKTVNEGHGSVKKESRALQAALQPNIVAPNNQTQEEPVSIDGSSEVIEVPGPTPDAPLAAKIASVSGNWNSTTTWGGAAVPVDGDAVTINSGITVTVTAPAACTSITFAAVTVNSGITISGTNSLTVSGSVTTTGRPPAGITRSINVNAGSMTIGTTLTMNATTLATRSDNINVTTGSFTVSGNITCGTTGCIFNISSTGTMNFGGTFSSTPTLTTVAGSTVNYTSGSAQTILAATYNGNLGLSGAGTKTIAASTSVTVNGNITNSSTFVLTAGTSTTSTWLTMGGNVTNTGTITATAAYARFSFTSANAQTFTNNGTVTSPIASFDVSNTNASGLTLAGSSGFDVTRANLFTGTVYGSNKITLGTGGTSYAVVQRGVSANTSPAGSFNVSPNFNVGSGGLNLLYDNGSVAYSTGTEIPGSQTAYIFYIFDAADVSLNSDLTITSELNFYGGTGTPTLRIGAHTLTLGGVITYTVAGAFYGGATSNLVMNGATALNAITNGLNNLTMNANVALGGAVTVNNTLNLANGILSNGSNLTMASGSTISRSAGSIFSAPTFPGTVNLLYTGGPALSTGKELPTGSSVINNLTSNAGGVTQYAFNTGSTNLLTDAFPNLTSWTGNIGTGEGFFNSNASVNAGGTTPEVRFTGDIGTPFTPSNTTFYIYRNIAVNTTGYTAVNVSFKTMSSGNYTQSVSTYLKLQSSTSTSGPWHDVWSVPYSALAAQTVTIPNYTTDVGGNMYFQFAFVGDYDATDYWYFDNFYYL